MNLVKIPCGKLCSLSNTEGKNYEALKRIYVQLRSEGQESVLKNLYIDRVDLCTYGNTKPMRVRVVNQFNDNHDYFYIKKADASRVYGLELEELLSQCN